MFHGSASLLRTVGHFAGERFGMSGSEAHIRETTPRSPKQDEGAHT